MEKKEGKGKEDFVESEIHKYGWKDIRIIDSLVIEQWLELAPSVAVWFAEEIGYPINDLMSAEKYYDSFAKTIKGVLPPDFFLNNRDNLFCGLKTDIEHFRANNQPQNWYIDVGSSIESILTLIAYLKKIIFLKYYANWLLF